LLNPRTDKPGGGFTVIYGPDGRSLCNVLAEDEEGILYADLDPAAITLAKATADPAGHYARADAVRLVINRGKRRVMTEINQSPTDQTESANPVVDRSA
jgi:aliphatic nitrilase